MENNSSWGFAAESNDSTLEYDEIPWEANSENRFTIGFDLIAPFDSIQYYNNERQLLKIISDFDQTSIYLVCAFLIEAGSLCCPLSSEQPCILIFSGKLPSLIEIKDSCLVEVEYCECEEDENNLPSLFCIQAAISFFIYHIIKIDGWFSFSLEEQSFGVLAKLSTGSILTSDTYIDVIAIKNVTITSKENQNSGTCSFETYCYKIYETNINKNRIPTFPSGLSEHKKDSLQYHHLFTNEPLSVLTSNEVNYLTAEDIINQKRGYNTYLPKNEQQLKRYLELAHGWKLRRSDKVLVKTDYGSKIIPTELLAKNITEIPARTRRNSSSIQQSIITILSTSLFRLLTNIEVLVSTTRRNSNSLYSHPNENQAMTNSNNDYSTSVMTTSTTLQKSNLLKERLQKASTLNHKLLSKAGTISPSSTNSIQTTIKSDHTVTTTSSQYYSASDHNKFKSVKKLKTDQLSYKSVKEKSQTNDIIMIKVLDQPITTTIENQGRRSNLLDDDILSSQDSLSLGSIDDDDDDNNSGNSVGKENDTHSSGRIEDGLLFEE